MIPDDVVDEVRARVDLVEIIGESVPLKRSGKDWKGRCPFHEDKTPSFYVVPEKGFYKCFGCGESGDVFTFLMKRSGMEFLDAVRTLGARYGVEIREVGRGDGEVDPLRAHHEANAFARSWFQEQLRHPEKGEPARQYLDRRGIGPETMEKFGLGFAPDGWRNFREAAAKHEIPEALLLEVGLLTTSERSSEPYDRFRSRIIFPIESVSGQVVAFGGRVLAGKGAGDAKGTPKYLNSPESPVYHKGELLYALSRNRNAIRKEGLALVVEGYMDVVSLSAAGVENAVAALGTALTEEHARLLARYVRRALLLFDSDEAGVRATFRAGDVLLAQGVHPSVVTLPEGEDPDSLVRAKGAAGLRPYLDGAIDVLDRKLQLLDEKGYLGASDGLRLAVDKLLPTLRAVRDPALRDIYVARVAERTGVRRETLEAELGGGPASRPRQRERRPEAPPKPSRVSGLGAEKKVLLVLLRMRAWVDRAVERIGPDAFRDPVYRAIFEALAERAGTEDPLSGLPPEAERRLEELMGDPEDLEHTERLFEDSLTELEERGLQARRDVLEEELRSADSLETERRLLGELARLRGERRGEWKAARWAKGRGGDTTALTEERHG
ncbi:MAG: DNA primase [Gemmatimonadetes bacterium]|nr:DNA primase [Gemmatimonadota bacterium]